MIDLHRHLEGSHSPKALATIAADYSINSAALRGEQPIIVSTASEIEKLVVAHGNGDWNTDFYPCIMRARKAYVNPQSISDLTYMALHEAHSEAEGVDLSISLASMTSDYLKNCKIENYSPNKFINTSKIVLNSVLDGVDRAKKEGMMVALRFGISRHPKYSEKSRWLLDVAKEYSAKFNGIDILAKEDTGNLNQFDKMIKGLKEVIPDLKIHCGELVGPEDIYAALEYNPNGIVHGVRAVEDYHLLDRLREFGITLEICPTSNNKLIPHIISSYRVHPLVTLMENGVKCAVATDDPAVFGTSLAKEMNYALELGVDLVQLRNNACARFNEFYKS